MSYKTYEEAFESIEGCGNENDIFDAAWETAFTLAYDKAKKEYDEELDSACMDAYRDGYQRGSGGLSSEY